LLAQFKEYLFLERQQINPIGFETVEFENGDKLTIENTGYESYTLIFQFETSRFNGDYDDVKFWYKTSVQLMEQSIKGIRGSEIVVADGLKALKRRIKTKSKLKFDEEISFGGTEIRSMVILPKPQKPSAGTLGIEVSFSIGPL
jgi:hypothetical protein